MKNQISISDRRRMARNADTIGAIMAARCLDPDGGGCTVSNPTARKTLAHGFSEVIRNGCKPLVQQITDAEAASLPGYCQTPPGATWWAAFGLDVDGRGTWVSRWAQVRGLPPEEARDAIEVRLLADLARACNVPGFPVMEAR